MKKIILIAATMLFVIAAGSAFAEDNAKTKKASDVPYNGITYFDLGAPSDDSAAPGGGADEKITPPYNGITYFDMTGSRLQPKSKEEKMPYNGITVFS